MAIKISIYACIVLALSSSPAYAYLDPGTGSIILQGLAAAFFTSIFFGRQIWTKIKSLLGLNRKQDDADKNVN